MKKTKWQAACIVCQFLCMFVVPVLLLWLKYGSNAFVAVKYKISITGVIFVLLFFVLSKRFWLDGAVKKMHEKLTNWESDAPQLVDQTAIASTKKLYVKYKYIDLFFKSIIPLIMLAGITIIIKALEEQALKMYGVFLWSTLSFAGGIVFKIIEIKLTRFPHEVKQ